MNHETRHCRSPGPAFGLAARRSIERSKGPQKIVAGNDAPHAYAAPIEELAVKLIGQSRARLRQERGEHFTKRPLDPAFGAVVNLERHPKPKPR